MSELAQINNSGGMVAQQGAGAFSPTGRAKSLVEYVAELDAAEKLGAWLCRIDTVDRAASTPTTPGLAGVSLTTLQPLWEK